MSDLQDKKKQPPRYPMGTIKATKNTLARLTRDLLTKKIDVQTYRAAAYGLSVQCSLFKFEIPEKTSQGIQLFKIPESEFDALETPEEREARLDELVEKHLAWKAAKEKAKEDGERYNEEFLKRRALSYESPGGEKVEVIKPEFLVDAEMEAEIGLSKNRIIEKVMGKQPEPTPESKQPATDPAAWRPCGIGVKR
jgi:hypothetical protein